jgi:hypothetical protein
MAEQEKQSVGVVSTVADLRKAVNSIIEPFTRDGTLAAFVRQGADEIGMALRAFPETIHAEEVGTILNPTQAEITNSRKPRLPTPSEIAADKTPYRPEPGHDQDHGRGMER